MKIFALVAAIAAAAAAIASAQSMPQFLPSGEANALPEAIRADMVIAEGKIAEARDSFRIWISSQPNPGSAAMIKIREGNFRKTHSDAALFALAVAITAEKAINKAIGDSEGSKKIARCRKKILKRWMGEAGKQLNLI